MKAIKNSKSVKYVRQILPKKNLLSISNFV